MSAPLVGITPIFAVCFWAFDVGKNLVRSVCDVPLGKDLSLLQIGVAGGLSAVPTTVCRAMLAVEYFYLHTYQLP